MESIQLAQMLADLSDLNAAQEPKAAVALVSANKSLGATPPVASSASQTPKPQELTPVRPGQRNHQRMPSSSSLISRTASPAKFDKFGRRIFTPPMSRTNSSQGSIPGTPRGETDLEDDIERANSLMALYEIRAKLREQDNTTLLKLREKLQAMKMKQQHTEKDASTEGRQSRFTYPKTPV